MNTNGIIYIYLFKTTPNVDKIFKELDDKSMKIEDFRWHQEVLKFEDDQEKLEKAIEKYGKKVRELFITPALQRKISYMRDYIKIQYEAPSEDELNFTPGFLKFIKESKIDIILHTELSRKLDEILMYKNGILVCNDRIVRQNVTKRIVDKKYKKYAKYEIINEVERLDVVPLADAIYDTEFRW
jgi:hypothetical protein